ncbi:MAG: hypothetical protein NTY09_08700 [bacterium]|nr:hypothetical protein [bacterium]
MEDSGSSQRTNSTSEGPDISDDPPSMIGFDIRMAAVVNSASKALE